MYIVAFSYGFISIYFHCLLLFQLNGSTISTGHKQKLNRGTLITLLVLVILLEDRSNYLLYPFVTKQGSYLVLFFTMALKTRMTENIKTYNKKGIPYGKI